MALLSMFSVRLTLAPLQCWKSSDSASVNWLQVARFRSSNSLRFQMRKGNHPNFCPMYCLGTPPQILTKAHIAIPRDYRVYPSFSDVLVGATEAERFWGRNRELWWVLQMANSQRGREGEKRTQKPRPFAAFMLDRWQIEMIIAGWSIDGNPGKAARLSQVGWATLST